MIENTSYIQNPIYQPIGGKCCAIYCIGTLLGLNKEEIESIATEEIKKFIEESFKVENKQGLWIKYLNLILENKLLEKYEFLTLGYEAVKSSSMFVPIKTRCLIGLEATDEYSLKNPYTSHPHMVIGEVVGNEKWDVNIIYCPDGAIDMFKGLIKTGNYKINNLTFIVVK